MLDVMATQALGAIKYIRVSVDVACLLLVHLA
jgi:hypothetical protein